MKYVIEGKTFLVFENELYIKVEQTGVVKATKASGTPTDILERHISRRRVLTEEQRSQIAADILSGMTPRQIVDKYNVTAATFYNIKKRYVDEPAQHQEHSGAI